MNTVTRKRMTLIFDEWARRYSENPDDFQNILDENGNPVEGYGESCALYFAMIAQEMDANGLLPLP